MLLFKTCHGCQRFLAKNEFYSYTQQNKNGLANYHSPKCKKCQGEANKLERSMRIPTPRVTQWQGE